MKLLTINVHAWQEENPHMKIKQLASKIHNSRYDAIALQEVSQHKEAPYLYNDIRSDNYGYLLQQELHKLGSKDYELVWDVSHYGYDVYEEGIALLLRHPINYSDSFYVTESESIDYWKSRKIVSVSCTIEGVPMTLFSCHLGWWGDEEESYVSQVDSLLSYVQGDRLTFLLGDFNASDMKRGEGYDYIKKYGWIDTHEEAVDQLGNATVEGNIAGWDHNKEGIKIDHIFCNQPIEVLRSEIVLDGGKSPVVSDHFGLEITCTIGKGKRDK
ncbi:MULTISPECIES: endonuclease/exonuclease/phosphatase family protein [Pontibacillus]|uniref:Endonuclease/exonuclease/phosphatase family protein n=1 Tax=Pontibacillus chungwhensis TaxID=265426 RepID=A0ABY8UVQ1_9BACI|nr:MULTISPECIES: endonuclease/exonuclease/phosphatase family protein [Pontibacillus]MCD5323116.1 endonuclease/exonuclease/phosphatase family protein [Pontibacillus sp. HN14]WIF96505.1 endonuclease/exonuclease/phosphatase family protein [Pontibacillus chungwhensis]